MDLYQNLITAYNYFFGSEQDNQNSGHHISRRATPATQTQINYVISQFTSSYFYAISPGQKYPIITNVAQDLLCTQNVYAPSLTNSAQIQQAVASGYYNYFVSQVNSISSSTCPESLVLSTNATSTTTTSSTTSTNTTSSSTSITAVPTTITTTSLTSTTTEDPTTSTSLTSTTTEDPTTSTSLTSTTTEDPTTSTSLTSTTTEDPTTSSLTSTTTEDPTTSTSLTSTTTEDPTTSTSLTSTTTEDPTTSSSTSTTTEDPTTSSLTSTTTEDPTTSTSSTSTTTEDPTTSTSLTSTTTADPTTSTSLTSTTTEDPTTSSLTSTTTEDPTTSSSTSTTSSILLTTDQNCIPLSQIKELIFSALVLEGTIRVNIFSKYALEYDNGVLIQAAVAFTDNSAAAPFVLALCGSGRIKNDGSSEDTIKITPPTKELCIYNDLNNIVMLTVGDLSDTSFFC